MHIVRAARFAVICHDLIASLDARRRGDTHTPHNLKTAFTERSDLWQLIEKDGGEKNQQWDSAGGTLGAEQCHRVQSAAALGHHHRAIGEGTPRAPKNIPWKAAPVFVLPRRLASADHKSSQPETSWPPPKKKKKIDLKNL